MTIERYVELVVKSPLPFLFMLFIIICEYIVYTWKGQKFSFTHVLSNFGVLFLGTTTFSLFSYFVISRDDVLEFTSQYSMFSTSVSWGIFLLWLIFFDFINYCTHVLYHKSSFFWMFHAVHHSDKTLDASTTIRVPIVASFFTITAYAFLNFFGISVVLLPALAQTMFLQQLLVHSSLFRTTTPSFLTYIFITPSMHAIHHTEKYGDKNYGFLFSVWDRLFKTGYFKNYNNESFGVDFGTATKNPLKIHMEPMSDFFKQ